MPTVKALFPLALLSLCLAGCAGSAKNYPSLAIRPVERISGTAQPAPPQVEPAPAVVPGSDFAERLAQLVASARTAHQAFLDTLPAARAAIAQGSGASVASDPWIRAEVALAGLETSRSQAQVALADLDTLYAQERDASYELGITPKAEAIAAARDQVQERVAEENRIIENLISAGG